MLVGGALENLITRSQQVRAVDAHSALAILKCCLSFYYILVYKSVSVAPTAKKYVEGLTRTLFQCHQQMVSRSKRDTSATVTDGAGIDLAMLDVLSLTWSRLPEDLQQEMSRDASSVSSHTRRRKNYDNEDEEEEGELEVVYESEVLELLHGVKFAAATLRCLSNEETDCRRLLCAPTVDVVTAGLKLMTSSVQVGQLLQSRSPYHKQLLGALVEVFVQLVGATRNFSLDKKGSRQLLQSQAVHDLCRMLQAFRAFPHLLLNCARATAKMSLQDTFRVQISEGRSRRYVKYLSEVVLREAAQCHLVMNGGGGAEEAEVDWPSWHTWPLLSRVCFTLGNLTTTNEGNRHMIGVQCKVLPSLVVLLQVRVFAPLSVCFLFTFCLCSAARRVSRCCRTARSRERMRTRRRGADAQTART